MPATEDTNAVINMRVTANSIQGHRKYMEDCYKIRFQRESSLMNSQNQALINAATTAGYFERNKLSDESDPQSDILFSYFGIFDGHGGKEASQFAKERLYWKIVEQEEFWSEDHSKVLNAIREGFIQCHMEMWNDLASWPKTASGLPSTSGSTATVLFIRKSKAYVGHVGDSGLLIGFSKDPKNSTPWQARKLTRDHKPEDPIELKRIESMGGSVATKSGVNRVVWNRPVLNPNKLKSSNNQSNPPLVTSSSVPYDLDHYKSRPVQIQTERIPFLAVARSLGDLWSYDIKRDEFIVSPVPDVFHFDLDPTVHKCLILATDGLWNVMRANECVNLVRQTDKETEKLLTDVNRTEIGDTTNAPVQPFVNPSQRLVNTAMQRCCEKMIRADNTSCITIMLDQPPSYEDYLTNSNETVIRATNLTNLDINKTFDQTGRILNISDDFDVDQGDNEDYLSDEALSDLRRSRQRRKSTKSTFNQTTSTEIPGDEFQTPQTDKRSRSLVSVRRRHWSASSNRSTSVSSTQHSQQRERSRSRANSVHKSRSKAKFVNTESREQRLASAHETNQKINRQYMNKSSSSNAVYPHRNQPDNRHDIFYNKSHTHLNDPYARSRDQYLEDTNYFNQSAKSAKSQRPMRAGKSKTRTSALTLRLREVPLNYSSRKSLLNVSSVSVGINKLSKNIRKSCNDLYSMTRNMKRQKSSATTMYSSDGSHSNNNLSEGKENKENQHATVNQIKSNDNSEDTSKNSKYSRRLQRLKARLIKTTANIFNKKRKDAPSDSPESSQQVTEECAMSHSRHASMPNLSKIELDENKIQFIDKNEEDSDIDDDEGSYCEIDLERPSMIRQQSFIHSVKSKLKKRKNGVSKKNLQSTVINPELESTSVTRAKQTKRTKFF